MRKNAIITTLLLLVSVMTAFAQSSSFNYQGRLNDAGAAANGTFQFQFKLFDAASGGTQIGATINDAAAPVTNGVFSVNPDFGAAAFSGGDRYLEVAVRRTSSESYVTLTPRQKINSAPYATRTAETTNFSGALAGDVSGTQNATIVNSVGGQSSANIANSVQATTGATSNNTANTLVKRDAEGKIKVGGVTFSDGTSLTSAASTGGTITGTSIVSALNEAGTTGTINENRLSNNVLRFSPTTPQLFVGDSDGTQPMINLRGGSTCCASPGGHTPAFFKVFQNGSFVATGNLGIGVSPWEGQGYRTSWHTFKGAFRSGYADNEWDDANTGFFSWAGGNKSTASGLYSLSFGDVNFARSTSSIAFGSGNEVKGAAGFSAGAANRVCDTYGVALGNKAISGGPILADGKCDPDTFN
ncbi:MAG TPA: hypothetical protein VK308_07095, partial [Pyrinomonadaceae bacterium]|nr:hypothetical protein [Pyrinomonadaceae bacterium]